MADLVGDMLTEGTPRAPPRRSPRTPQRWAARSTSTSARTGPRSAATSSRSSARTSSRLVADVVAQPEVPGNRASRACKADRAAPALDRPQPAAAARAGEVPRRPLRRPPVRPPLSDRGDAQGLHPRAGPRASTTRTTAPAARTCTSPAASTPPPWRPPFARRFGDWKRGPAPNIPPANPKSSRAVYILDRPGAVQSTILMGMPVIDPSKPDWDALFLMNVLLGGSFSSRITSNIREAKGYTYSPNGTALEPLPRRVLGGGRRRHDEGDRARRQGDPRRGRPPAVRAADGEGAQGLPELPRRASSSSRTPRAAASSASSSSWTCTAFRRTT